VAPSTNAVPKAAAASGIAMSGGNGVQRARLRRAATWPPARDTDRGHHESATAALRKWILRMAAVLGCVAGDAGRDRGVAAGTYARQRAGRTRVR
jgi:hypothetical protein